jgi:hypothetical protein
MIHMQTEHRKAVVANGRKYRAIELEGHKKSGGALSFFFPEHSSCCMWSRSYGLVAGGRKKPVLSVVFRCLKAPEVAKMSTAVGEEH